LDPVNFIIPVRGHLRQRPGFSKIRFANIARFGFGPFFQTHFIDQAQIEDLNVVWQCSGLVSIRVEVIAGKLVAIATKFQTVIMRAFMGCAVMRFTENMLLKRDLSITVLYFIRKQLRL